jgi:hypothetical protein
VFAVFCDPEVPASCCQVLGGVLPCVAFVGSLRRSLRLSSFSMFVQSIPEIHKKRFLWKVDDRNHFLATALILTRRNLIRQLIN